MNENIKAKGFIRVTLVNKETGEVISEEKHNFVSNAMKRVALAQSLSMDLCPNTGTPYGMIWCFNNNVWKPLTSAGGWASFVKVPDSPTLALLKFDDGVVLDSTSKYLPILTANGEIDYSKVIGYSVGRAVSTNNYEGVLTDTVAKEMVKFENVTKSFLFDVDIATGEFNWLAILPGWGTHPFHALQAFKCLSNYNKRINTDSNRYGWVRPGVTDGVNVLTSDDEILLFFNHNGSSKFKYNITTGALTRVGLNDFAYNWNCTNIIGQELCGNQLVVNNKLFVITNNILYKINIQTGSSEGSVTIGSTSGLRGLGMWYDGQYIWTSSYHTSKSSNNSSYVICINPNSMSVVSKTYNTDYSGWGGLPATWNKQTSSIHKIGDVWYVYNYEVDSIIACSNLTNVCGSILGILPGKALCGFECQGKTYHFYQGNVDSFIIGSETADGNVTFTPSGFWLSDDTYSNFWSAAKLEETKVKGPNIQAYVNYGYELE